MSTLTIYVDGQPVEARRNDTVAVALLRAGISASGELSGRGLFCGMGSCYECHAVIDGIPFTRTCMTTVESGMQVQTRAEQGAKDA